MQGDPTLGLDLIAGDANLTFVFFIAFVVQAVISVRFAYYAARNRRQSDLGQQAVYGALVGVGLTGAAYALLGVLDVASSLQTPYRNGVMVAHVALLAVALQALRDGSRADGEGSGWLTAGFRRRLLWLLAVVVPLAIVLVTAAGLGGETVATAEGLAATGFLAVGGIAGLRATAARTVQGTALDTLVRHLVPVLLFAALVPMVALSVLAGLTIEIVLHVQVVLVIMAATTLMTATIKLRQHLAGL